MNLPYHKLFDKRKITDFNKSIQNTINFMTISRKINLVGSSSLEAIKYYQDFDLNEMFNEDGNKNYPLQILNLFRNKFNEALQNQTTYIMDFKCGLDVNGESLHWTKKDIDNGFIINGNNEKVKFVDAILQKSIMKLDVIEVLEDGLLGEFSDIYLIKICNRSNFTDYENSKAFILNGLLKSYDEYYYVEHNYYKSLKRILSIKMQEGKIKYRNDLINLIKFFNSDIGMLNKVMTNIYTIEELINNKFKKVNKDIIRRNIEHNLNMLNKTDDNLVRNFTINKLKNIRTMLYNKINKASLEYINSNKSILPY